MPDRPHNQMSKIIGEEAARWYVCLREGNPSGADRLNYVRWLKKSPAHVRAMLEVALVEDLLRRSNLRGMPPTRGKSAVVVDFATRHDRAEMSSERRWRSSWHRWKFTASEWLSRLGLTGCAIPRSSGSAVN